MFCHEDCHTTHEKSTSKLTYVVYSSPSCHMELSSREIQQITKEVLNTQNKIIIKMEHVKKKDSLVKDYLRN